MIILLRESCDGKNTDSPVRMGVSRLQTCVYGFVAILSVGLSVPNADADVVLSATSATVTQPGEVARICILMDDGGDVVAGTQNDLVWDGACATIEQPADSSCTANARHGKMLSAAFPPRTDFTLRAFVLSLNDTDPISETELYCCNVRSELTEPGTSCSVNITRVGASTPDGAALPTRSGVPARITYAGRGQGQVEADDDDGGCQVGRGRDSGLAILFPPIFVVLLALRRRYGQGTPKRGTPT